MFAPPSSSSSNSNTRSVITTPKNHFWIKVSALLSLALIVLGIATLLLIQKPIQESQDLRQQASVEDGQVQVAFSPVSGTNLDINEISSIDFRFTTNSVQVEELALVFNIITDTIPSPPEFVIESGSGLEVTSQEIEATQDGYLVSLVVANETEGTPIAASALTTSGQLVFTPTSGGSIEFNFDIENSQAIVFNSTPADDELLHVATQTYTVGALASASPTVSPSTTPSPSATASPSSSPSVSPSASPSVTPTPSPTASPDTNGTGGVTTVSCNESCSSNDECQPNHRCYENRCRLVTNVSSTSCAATTVVDNGLNRTCNQYCADARECASGYSCYFNRCRNPLNIESVSCTAPSQSAIQAMATSCNQRCTTHKDCAANLLCYGPTNTCRLATNPASTSCSPTISTTVSPLYNQPKGGNGSDGKATSSATTRPVSSITITSSPQPTTDDNANDLPIKNQSALEAAGEYLRDQLASRGVSLPILFIVAGIFLLLVVGLMALLSRMSRGSRPPVITPVGSSRDSQKDAQYEDRLASKINSLQQQQQNPEVVTKTSSTQTTPIQVPVTPTSRPTFQNSSSVVAPVPTFSPKPSPQPLSSQPLPSEPAPVPTPTPTKDTVGSAPSPISSSMMARLQNKGIKPPTTSEPESEV